MALPIIPVITSIVGVASKVIDLVPALKRKFGDTENKITRVSNTKLSKAMSSIMYAGLVLVFLWEILGRMVIIPMFWPELMPQLPASILDQTLDLITNMSPDPAL